jgi:hypothetical protein
MLTMHDVFIVWCMVSSDGINAKKERSARERLRKEVASPLALQSAGTIEL